MKLWEKQLPELSVDAWIMKDIVPEGSNWNTIICNPAVTNRYVCTHIDGKGPTSRPRRFPLSVSHKDLTSDILTNCEIEKGERVLYIVCEIPDPEYLEPVGRSIEETKAADKKVVKKEPVTKNTKAKNPPAKDKVPDSAHFKAPFRPATRKTRANGLDEDVVETENVKLEGIKEEGLEVKEESSSESESNGSEAEV